MFSKDFIWGVSTAAFQIEGAAYEDGKGPSVWDTYCKVPGKIKNGDTGDVACDHYHRYKEDVALMKELGVKNYRFSVSWPRIIPNGTGEVNPKGIEFYSNLVDELLKAGITPYVTLFHWDTPQAVEDRGGWMNPEVSDWFANYTAVVADALGDRVKNFITFNEPQCFIGAGYCGVAMAPEKRQATQFIVKAAHNVLLSHGKAVKVLREKVKDVKVGYAPCGNYYFPADENSESDIEAARKLTFSMEKSLTDFGWSISWWSDPVCLGRYPDEYIDFFEKFLPENWQKDMETIYQPLDFYGQNLYQGTAVTTDENGEPICLRHQTGYPHTSFDWPVTPKAIKWAAIYLQQRYKKPIIFTENGMANADVVSLDGKVHDPARIDFLHRYLKCLSEANDMGADVIGYFQWSFMDNMEWASGYNQRFGLVFVDYQTLERIPKDSAYWYKQVMETNGENI